MAGKGSAQRPTDRKKFDENYDRIFGRNKSSDEIELIQSSGQTNHKKEILMDSKIAFIQAVIEDLNQRIVQLINDPNQITAIFNHLPDGVRMVKSTGYKQRLEICNESEGLFYKGTFEFNPEGFDSAVLGLDSFCSQLKQACYVLAFDDTKLMEFLSIPALNRRQWLKDTLALEWTNATSSGFVGILQYLEAIKKLRAQYQAEEPATHLKLVKSLPESQ